MKREDQKGGQAHEARRKFEVFADFLDGRNALVRRVFLTLQEDGISRAALVITDAEGNRRIWPFHSLRALPDQAGNAGLVLRQAGPSEERLIISDQSAAAYLRANCPYLHKRPPITARRQLLGWGLGAIGSVFLIVMVLIPLLANQLAAMLPPAAEKALGDATLEQIREGLDRTGANPIRLCEREKGLAALQAMQARLTEGMDLPYPVNVHVLDHPMVNAFALPGGHVVFFRGLIDEAETPEEVAAVFAHELGHVAHRDPARIALRTAGSVGVLGLLFGDFAGGTVVLFLTERLVQASYTREAEALADAFAHEALSRAGISPAALASMFERLRRRYGDSEGIIAHFATHPAMVERIERAKAAARGLDGQTEPLLDQDQWADLQSICGVRFNPLDFIKKMQPEMLPKAE